MVLCGPPLAGAMVDLMGAKGVAMIVSGIAMTTATFFYFLAFVFRKKLLPSRNGYTEI